MNDYIIYGIGFLAQLLFGSRMVIQWIQSERAKRVLSPTLFWKTSLVASALFLVYGLLRQDSVIILGQLLSYFIYIRNLQLNGEWKKLHVLFRFSFTILPFLIFLGLWHIGLFSLELTTITKQLNQPLILIGGTGQLLLNFRFVYQWHLAEKTKQTDLPFGFWVISSIGSILVIIYSVFKLDPVLLLAQVLGIVVYSRNIILYKRSQSNSNYHAS